MDYGQRSDRMHDPEQLVYRKRGLAFTWEGGEYIDVTREEETQPVAVDNVGTITDGVSHVTIPFEQEAFEAECNEWLDGLGPEEIAEYGVKPE